MFQPVFSPVSPLFQQESLGQRMALDRQLSAPPSPKKGDEGAAKVSTADDNAEQRYCCVPDRR